ncbi:MAG TPA: hypothetical protein VFE47_10830 [Tepidisphaeraceae bacterium]|jgi:hypothetical protein|nr:hypothetical protein [Tepidisphaeraceae bacterium]
MKHLIALAVIVSMLGAASFVYARGGKGASGYTGTISTLGSAGFAMTTDDGKELKVLCNANTKFQTGGKDGGPATAKDIREGAHVTVQGGISGDKQVMATMVTILPAKKGK